jgi:DHA2 family multidrug resistance protein
MTAASGLYNVIRQVFASVGIALAATFLTRGEIWYRAVLTEHVTGYSDLTSESLHQLLSYLFFRGANASGTDMEAFGLLEGMVGRQAAMLAYNHVFFLIALLFLLLVPMALLIRDPQRARGAEMVTD